MILVLSACNNRKQTVSNVLDIPAKSPDESELFTRLYADFTDRPTTQAQIDQNLIIDYAATNYLDVTRTPSGLYYMILAPGEGSFLKPGDRVSAHYHGYFLDGKKFDSSYDKNRPIRFRIGQMIAGWNEGLTYLKPGGKAKLLVPSGLGYGTDGFPGYVKPNKVLVFDIEVLN